MGFEVRLTRSQAVAAKWFFEDPLSSGKEG